MVDKHKILAEFKKYFETRGKVSIDSAGVISVKGGKVIAKVVGNDLATLPVKFGVIEDDLVLTTMSNIDSFKNFPTRVNSLTLDNNQALTNFSGLENTEIGYALSAGRTNITTVDGVPPCRIYQFDECKNLQTVRGIPKTFSLLSILHCPLITNIDHLFMEEHTNSNQVRIRISIDYGIKLLWPILFSMKYGSRSTRLDLSTLPSRFADIIDPFIGAGQGELMALRRALKQAGLSGNT
jgi:hypothetical protein